MNALEQKLASLLPQEMLALLEKIESLEGAENDYAIATYINNTPLTKFERFMLVRAYHRYESRQARFRAMELLFPSPKKEEHAQKQYLYPSDAVTVKREGGVIAGGYNRSRVGHI